MIAYQLDENGFFIGEITCQKDPIKSTPESPKYLIPRGAILIAPPDEIADHLRKWNGTAWEQIENHVGKTIYKLKESKEVTEYGSIESGWSLTKTDEYIAWEEDLNFKLNRQDQLDGATVTVNGNIYDANETARSRMLSAILAAEHTGATVIPFWNMADSNVVKTVENIPLAEFKDAHAAVMQFMSTIWNPAP